MNGRAKETLKNSPERNGNVGKDTGLKISVISGGKKRGVYW
jgi:hypothetical protein